MHPSTIYIPHKSELGYFILSNFLHLCLAFELKLKNIYSSNISNENNTSKFVQWKYYIQTK